MYNYIFFLLQLNKEIYGKMMKTSLILKQNIEPQKHFSD